MAKVDDVRNKVQRILAEKFGSARVDSDGDFFVTYQSAVVFVRVRDWMDSGTVVKIFSHVLRDIKVTPEVYKWVATNSINPMFGAFGLAEGDHPTILLSHNLLGDSLDPDELLNAVAAVAIMADEQDDKLQKMFGGRRMIED